MIYADTSFLLSLYITDANTPKADVQMEKVRGPIFWTDFHQVEFDTALESRVRRGQTTREQADGAYEALTMHREVLGVYFEGAVLWGSVWSRAIALGRRRAAEHVCRTLDIVHLSLALEMGAGEFLSFDERQNGLARVLDLKTLGE